MAGYVVLARKYRPRTFHDVLGQSVVTAVLKGALREKRIGQAYLFAGPRGTGKTTTARILARCLNCVQGPTPEPCGVCEHCTGIDAANDPDLIEIDAASHTGVDYVRELREQATYAPMKARYKVYLVDEVHMLSKAAFNALLKTLEEPPPHVVFLFATTELHRVLPTIVSRCQVLKLAPLSEAAIAERLRAVLSQEGVTPGPGLVEEIARGARGGMRDALSLADKLLALAGNEPTLDDLRRLGGHAGAREVEALLAQVETGDRRGVLEALEGVEGSETELVSALLEHLRLSLIAAFCGGDSPMLPSEPAARELVIERGRRLTGDRVELWMQELLHARERMRTFPGQERLVLELVLLDLARPETTLSLSELEARLAALESSGPAEIASAPRPAPRAPSAPAQPAPPRRARPPEALAEGRDEEIDPEEIHAEAAPSPPARRRGPDAPTAARAWDELLAKLAQRHGALAEILKTRGRLVAEGGGARLALTGLNEAERALCSDRRNQAAVRRALEEVSGSALELAIDLEGVESPGRGRPARGSADAFTKEVADLFGGVIEDLS